MGRGQPFAGVSFLDSGLRRNDGAKSLNDGATSVRPEPVLRHSKGKTKGNRRGASPLHRPPPSSFRRRACPVLDTGPEPRTEHCRLPEWLHRPSAYTGGPHTTRASPHTSRPLRHSGEEPVPYSIRGRNPGRSTAGFQNGSTGPVRIQGGSLSQAWVSWVPASAGMTV